MRRSLLPLLLAAPLFTTTGAQAADPASEAPVQPQIDRRDVRVPRFPSNDFEVGLFFGPYSTQNFGSSIALGGRLGYHITEDFFVEAAYGRTTVSDDAFKRVLPGGVFTPGENKLSYSDLSVGVNVLPGEVFLGRDHALPSQLYLIAGAGTTHFNGQRQQTFNFGLGTKVYWNDSFALRVDLRDHVFSLDLLGKRDSTHNLELTAGASFLF